MKTHSKLRLFLLQHTGTVFGEWVGAMTAMEQRRLFGQSIGQGRIVINGQQQTVSNRIKQGYFPRRDVDQRAIAWSDLRGSELDRIKDTLEPNAPEHLLTLADEISNHSDTSGDHYMCGASALRELHRVTTTNIAANATAQTIVSWGQRQISLQLLALFFLNEVPERKKSTDEHPYKKAAAAIVELACLQYA